MAMITDASLASETEAEGLAFAREVLRIEAEAIERVRDRLDDTIARAADLIYRCPGSVIVTGMGKAGLVGQKLAATLASTGTRAFPLHPAEAVHGDLGRIRADDVVIALSQSGETEEVLRLIPRPAAAGGVPGRDHRASRQLARPGGRPLHRSGADRGGVPARPGPLGQHDRPDGRRRRPGPAGEPDAQTSGRGLRPLPPGGQPRPQAGPGRGRDADRRADPPGTSRRDGPRGLRPAWPAPAGGRGRS